MALTTKNKRKQHEKYSYQIMVKLNKCSDRAIHLEQNICRICLGNNLNLQSLYNSFKEHSYTFYVNSISNVNITQDDKLPKKICKLCIDDLKSAVKFKEKCEKSNNILHGLIKKSQNDTFETVRNKNISLGKEESEDFLNGTNPLINANQEKILVKDEKLDVISNDSNDFCNNSISDNDPAPTEKCEEIAKILATLDCLECGKTFMNESKKKMHWYNVHFKKTYKKCKTCFRVFKSPKAFEKHVNQKVPCIEQFKGIQIVGSGKSRTFHCSSCDHVTNSVADLRKHLLRHSGARPYTCNLCPKSYKSHKALSYHKESFHKLFSAKITCHMCGKVVEGRHKFNKHFHSHDIHTFQCDICKAFIKSKWGLICHIKGHENRKEYVCESCGRGFNTGFNLRNHIRRVHENIQDRKHSCHLCKYKTKSIKNLKEHMQQHSLDKLQCSICARFIDTPLKLVKHMKLHGEKKHFCLYCNKGFATKRQCTEHVRWVHDKRTKQKNPIALNIKQSSPDNNFN